MWWQNASARTPTSTTPSASAVQSRSSSRRTVVAPSRRLQYAAKSCSPRSPAVALLAGGVVERPRPGDDVPAHQRVDRSGSVRETVGVAAPERPEPGVERIRHPRAGSNVDVVVEHAVEPRHQTAATGRAVAAGGPGEDLAVDVQVDDLAPGMHPGVGPAGAGHRSRRAQHGRQRLLEGPLHRAQAGCAAHPWKASPS